ncbi:MAG: hypothetical protein WBK20_06570 [Spirochaetota bacterium]
MEFETTTCIVPEYHELLLTYAKRCDLPVSKFVISLINYAASLEKKKKKPFKNIRYRKRSGKEWERMHLCLSFHEYEFLLDMKKLWKMSVALLIEFCIENVLEEFVEALLKEEHPYSYRFMHYTFDFSSVYGMPSYRCIWGLPPEIVAKTL